MDKIRIAIDIDECLAPFLDYFSEYYNDHWKGKRGIEKVETKDFFSYHFADVLKISDADSDAIVEAFQESPLFHNQKPFENAYECLKKMKEKYDLYVVTSRSFSIEKQTRKVIGTYFPNIFEKIEFGNSYGKFGKKRGKGEICKSLNCKVLVDDSPKYCNQVVLSGMKAILFGQFPWNDEKLFKIEKSVVRVDGWEEVEKVLESLLI